MYRISNIPSLSFVCAAALLLPTISHADPSPADQVAMAKDDLRFDEYLGKTNTACGTTIKASIDWPAFNKNKTRKSVSGYCSGVLTQLKKLCAGENTRAYIKKNVKEARCTLTEKGKRNLSFNNGVLTLYVDWAANNYDQYVRAALVEKL